MEASHLQKVAFFRQYTHLASSQATQQAEEVSLTLVFSLALWKNLGITPLLSFLRGYSNTLSASLQKSQVTLWPLKGKLWHWSDLCLFYILSCFSHVRLFTILWTIAQQSPPSMGFSKEEYQSGLPCLPPGDLPDPGIEPASPALVSRFLTTSTLFPQICLLYMSLLLKLTSYSRGETFLLRDSHQWQPFYFLFPLIFSCSFNK